MSDTLLGGNPQSYWNRPFDERWKHWARPGVRIWVPRKGRLVLVWDGEKEVSPGTSENKVLDLPQTLRQTQTEPCGSDEKCDTVSEDHVTVLTRSTALQYEHIGVQKRFCEACGKPLERNAATQRRYCSSACRKGASREKTVVDEREKRGPKAPQKILTTPPGSFSRGTPGLISCSEATSLRE